MADQIMPYVSISTHYAIRKLWLERGATQKSAAIEGGTSAGSLSELSAVSSNFFLSWPKIFLLRFIPLQAIYIHMMMKKSYF